MLSMEPLRDTLGNTANSHKEQNHNQQAAGLGIVRGQSRNIQRRSSKGSCDFQLQRSKIYPLISSELVKNRLFSESQLPVFT